MEKTLVSSEFNINYNNRKFIAESNSENGEVDSTTVFNYYQNGKTVWATYEGGSIAKGHLIGTVSLNGTLTFNYHHININNEYKSGICHSTPYVQANGKIKLSEKWQWTNGDCSFGTSELTEL